MVKPVGGKGISKMVGSQKGWETFVIRSPPTSLHSRCCVLKVSESWYGSTEGQRPNRRLKPPNAAPTDRANLRQSAHNVWVISQRQRDCDLEYWQLPSPSASQCPYCVLSWNYSEHALLDRPYLSGPVVGEKTASTVTSQPTIKPISQAHLPRNGISCSEAAIDWMN